MTEAKTAMHQAFCQQSRLRTSASLTVYVVCYQLTKAQHCTGNFHEYINAYELHLDHSLECFYVSDYNILNWLFTYDIFKYRKCITLVLILY